MLKVKQYKFWFVTGSQHLYGDEILLDVERNSKRIVEELNRVGSLPYDIEFISVLTNAEDINKLILNVNANEGCAGLITWMHTFSPGKMWINGLLSLQKPLLHLHTQYNLNIPWETIDMDYMNLHQSAHGDREYGFTVSSMNIPRKVIVGHWQNSEVHDKIKDWMKTAVAKVEGKNIRVARFGDNMRNVAVTEGNKVEAQRKFGWSVDSYGIGDLVQKINEIDDILIEGLFQEYQHLYQLEPEAFHPGSYQVAVKEQARIELALESFLEKGNYTAFTTNFENLHGMKQLPGLAVQRLMAKGYGFAAEGDWRTAALLRTMKIIANNKDTSFMEDYTYHLEHGQEMVLGSHMLEVCPTISAEKPKLIVRPLSIGGKEDPARLVFNGKSGKGVVVSLVEYNGRFRLIVNEILALQSKKETPELPVAKVFWQPQPTLTKAVEAWIYSGGSHHVVFSLAVSIDQLYDFADMTNIESIVIDQNVDLYRLRNELKMNEIIWKLR